MATIEAPRGATPANPTTQVTASMVGAVATTLASSTLGGSPTGNLIAAALGAAIPPFATYVGPRQHLRLGVALAAIALALAVTYGGVTLFDAAADKQTFPGPNDAPRASAPGPASPATAVTSAAGGIGIRVTPELLRCTPDGCDSPVVIESTGSEPLRTLEIEAGDHFVAGDECEHRLIERGEPCEFTVAYDPPQDLGTVRAELVIHQNLEAPATVVGLEGSGGPPASATDIAFAAAACTLEPGPIARFTLTAAGPDGATVPVAIAMADGSTAEGSITAGTATPIDVGLAAEPVDALPATVTLDPDDAIAEDDEGNNQRQLSCA